MTAHVWTEHSVWPQDPQFGLARAGGVTTLLVLPGSANLIGGRGVTLKNVAGRSVYDMKFPDAPHALKMACGENPKRVYGGRFQAPMTRMGNVAGYRAAWIEASAYRDKWREYHRKLAEYEAAQDAAQNKDTGDSELPEDEHEQEENGASDPPEPPKRDLGLETLAGALDGEILVHNHCYRADEMITMLNIAREFGYSISTFHHAIESYKITDVLARHGVCSAVWADWWGFKLEAWDMVTRERRAHTRRRRLRDHSLGQRYGYTTPQSGNRQSHGRGSTQRHRHRRGDGDYLDHEQSRARHGHRPCHRLGRSGQSGRPRYLERQPLKRVRARHAGLHRRRVGLRSFRAGRVEPFRFRSRANLHGDSPMKHLGRLALILLAVIAHSAAAETLLIEKRALAYTWRSGHP